MTVSVALVQLDIEPVAVDTNLQRAAAAVETAAENGAELVVLPELFTIGFFEFDAYADSAVGLESPLVDRLRSIAVENGVGLVAGSFVEDLNASHTAGFDTPATEGYANTVTIFDADGSLEGVYRKRHLFGYESAEATLLVAGERETVVEFGELTLGISVCYDLRFPELYRSMIDSGVDTIIVPSAWPYPRTEHWETLGRARAIENLAYVLTANGVGTFGDSQLCGRSTIYDPWGTTLAGAGDDETIVTAELDPDRVAAIRADFPSLRDRRL
ncbi:carbon-nitrogen family hydrolase [Natronocalculus amylovorans]|uniref:Carbon-nitrogen family hydrolase n=1 Tax=Natronocalculus amylovorans TaxID=2917812 RepID=A0AAE3K8I1_9EURY|nr:carbon-nitrogen family hydrolase [Natronocalculus amylovorans]MCL9817063.1 carbon-nitrogen family hydrolase [Natronocalculus amylovorans]